MKLRKTTIGILLFAIVATIGLLVYSRVIIKDLTKINDKIQYEDYKHLEQINELKSNIKELELKGDTIIVKDLKIKEVIKERGLKYEEDLNSVDSNDVISDIELFSEYTR